MAGGLVAAFVGVMIAMYIGITLLPTLAGGVAAAQADTNVGSNLDSLIGLLPIVFLAIIIIAAVGYIGIRNRGRGM